MKEIIDTLKIKCIEISNLMRYTDPFNLSQLTEENNTSGDDVKKLDILSNDILKEGLSKCNEVKIIGSEEEKELYYTEHINGQYMVCYDPLDGSSNIDSNITVGTIFAIYDINKGLKDGNSIVCAGYCLYGSSTQFVIAINKVEIYLLKNEEFKLINDNLKIKEGKIYSINESNKFKWIGNKINMLICRLIDKSYSARWIGSMVTDCHRTLIKGGLFAYPNNNIDVNGKIRLLYEAYPFAYIFKIAGGDSFNGKTSILDIKFPSLQNIHQKTSIFLGGINEIEMCKYCMKD